MINLEARVRQDHPLRRIKPWAERALGELSPVAADKGYHCRGVVDWCRAHQVAPHVATLSNRQVPGLDARTLRTKAYLRQFTYGYLPVKVPV